MLEMAFWRSLYWVVVFLYVCAIGVVALVIAVVVTVIIRKIIERWKR